MDFRCKDEVKLNVHVKSLSFRNNVKLIFNPKKSGLLLLTLIGLFSSTTEHSFGQITQTLNDHVPAVLGRMRHLGRKNGEDRIDFTVALPFRNLDGLKKLFKQIYDVKDPQFHNFLSPDEFTKRFAPFETDYENLKEFLRKQGFVIDKTYPGRSLISVHGKVNLVEKAFSVEIHTYQRPDGSEFFSTDREPSVQLETKVL